MKALRDLPWSLWRQQLRAVVRLEFTKSVFRKRGLWIYLLSLAPLLLMGAHAVFMSHRPGRCTLSRDTVMFAGMFQLFILRLVVFFGCVGIFMNLFRGEVLDRSLHYYFLAPVRREILVIGKYVAGLITAILCFATSTAVSFLVLFSHFGAARFQEFLFQESGLEHLAAYAGVTMLACAGYGAVFLAMGMVFQNPMIPAAIVWVWEAANPLLPPALKKISVIFYLKSLCPVAVPAKGVMAFLTLATEPTPPALAIPGVLAVALALLVFAALRSRRMEISYVAE